MRKKDGKLQLYVDYRLLNAKTLKDAYPLSRIDEALDVLKGAEYFCSLDLVHGFNQIPMRAGSLSLRKLLSNLEPEGCTNTQ